MGALSQGDAAVEALSRSGVAVEERSRDGVTVEEGGMAVEALSRGAGVAGETAQSKTLSAGGEEPGLSNPEGTKTG